MTKRERGRQPGPLDVAARIIAAARYVPIREREAFLRTRPEVVDDRIALTVDRQVSYLIVATGVVWRFQRDGSRLRGWMYGPSRNPGTGEGRW